MILIFPNFCTKSRQKRRTKTHMRSRTEKEGSLTSGAVQRGKGVLETLKKKGMTRTPRVNF